MHLIATWYPPSHTPFSPFQVSSAPYSSVPWIFAIWRFLDEARGTPCLSRSRRGLASACLARLTQRRRFHFRVRAKSDQRPSRRVASLAKRTVWVPTLISFSPLFCQRLRSWREAWSVVSKRTALSSARLRLASAHRSSLQTRSAMLSFSTAQVTLPTKEPRLLSTWLSTAAYISAMWMADSTGEMGRVRPVVACPA